MVLMLNGTVKGSWEHVELNVVINVLEMLRGNNLSM